VALQGDLKSFALPDVLRLLAGTGKSGRLEVVGAGTGELVLFEGAIAAAAVTSAPHATGPADVVFDLLRFEDGSFSFEEDDELTDAGLAADIETTIELAEALVLEWEEVETVVPSMHAWLSLVAEIEDETRVTPDQWKAIAAVAGGGTVVDLADALELNDLAACRQAKDLIELGLLDVRESAGTSTPSDFVPADHAAADYAPAEHTLVEPFEAPVVELDDFERYEVDGDEEHGALSDFDGFSADERPVVMEDSEDALLPEPLPGEGVAYAGESITGVVDGRIDAPEPDDAEQFEAFESLASFEAEAAMSDLAGEPGTTDTFGSVDDFAAFAAADDDTDGASDHEADEPQAELDELDDEPQASEDQPPADDERGSLLKFLSSVKP
jgi:hypothetical protein